MGAPSLELSRRSVLRTSGLAAVVTGLGGWSLLAPSGASAQPGLVRSTFAPLVGKVFLLRDGGITHRAVLQPLGDITRTRQGGGAVPAENAFSLRLLSETAVPSGLYTASHPRAGAHLLHFESVAGRPDFLEAVIYSALPRKVS